jgi:hypothetical protein
MRRQAIAPPDGRQPAVRPDPEKTKTFLRRKKPTQFADSSGLPLVGPEASKIPLERNLSPAPGPAPVQAHPSMRICWSETSMVFLTPMPAATSEITAMAAGRLPAREHFQPGRNRFGAG